ncbi:leucyl aminopeptidase [Sphingomonas montanisoli]|uniref:Probable cytosol aminopeptidase n=1 Tax=Sphingomonas montanisoli TaxID=2606412 RepID=A0A5D9CCW6_9SPHN|nr:leucyl aminopeptidase [Sphingomonas montanisoli]TZG28992.1 leucyl aminopeptidase [Sphingomonas montanisoli]
MRVRFAASRPSGDQALAIVVAPGTIGGAALAALPQPVQAIARRAASANRFDGETGGVVEFFAETDSALRRILLVGVGARGDYERAGAALVAKLLTSGETGLTIELGQTATGEAAASLAFGATLRSWRHDAYRTKLDAKQRPSLEEIVIVGAGAGVEDAWATKKAVAEGVMFTRELIAEPANILYPESFVERCKHLTELGVQIDVLGVAEMRDLGMGALLGVAQGSLREPRLLVMKWDGTGGTKDRVALVGKGVTFDTGGISLKPPAGMEDMKWDMGGAGAVAGAMKALAGRKAKAHVIGVCGLVENMPDGGAQRPGDVVTSMSGQTIEVINTDAEGRLVLCDALTWVQKTYSPKTIVDLATLTGAMIISLGHEYGGMFANDDSLATQLDAAGKAVGDQLWRMPLADPFDKLIDSPIADMKNVGPREGGSITAAHFLKRYIDDGVRWAHLDIAGMVWASKPGATWDKGATGFGVRLLDRFIADNFEG